MKKITILSITSVALLGAVAGLETAVKADSEKTDISANLKPGSLTLEAPPAFNFGETPITNGTISFTPLDFDEENGVKISNYIGDGAIYKVSAKVEDDKNSLTTLGDNAAATLTVNEKKLSASDSVVQTVNSTDMIATHGETSYSLTSDLKLSGVTLAGAYKGTVIWTLGTDSKEIAE